ncbi:tail fiber domain-containing protein [Pseudomonas asiatica]|uniref:tail fiber domain-containing protein n=1 Tax=Pseudomonas asiatica TaxID=2219225 RepID=UPI0025A0B349|nr:tail fiber domain-containing protein [Pseudomonas asiatica]WJM55985.1 tail fiber domain-containing protein [Pseudomonas asiatica]
MADQTQRLEIATVRAEVGSNIVFRFANDAANADNIPTQSGDIKNLKQVVLEIQQDASDKISISTTIYATVAAGLAATADQGIFLVQSNDADEIYTVWQNQGGTAVNTGKTALSATAIQAALEASSEAAQAAEDAADVAIKRTARYLAPSSTPPTVRDDGLPLQIGDVWFDNADQSEYIYKSTGWEANDSLQAIDDIRNQTDPLKGAAEVGFDSGNAADVLLGAKSLQSYAVLRAYTGRATGVRITQRNISGNFEYDPEDTTSPDNGATVIVTVSGKRYKRNYSGALKLDWFIDPAATDHTEAWIKAIQLNNSGAAKGVLLEVPRFLTKVTGSLPDIKAPMWLHGSGTSESVVFFAGVDGFKFDHSSLPAGSACGRLNDISLTTNVSSKTGLTLIGQTADNPGMKFRVSSVELQPHARVIGEADSSEWAVAVQIGRNNGAKTSEVIFDDVVINGSYSNQSYATRTSSIGVLLYNATGFRYNFPKITLVGQGIVICGQSEGAIIEGGTIFGVDKGVVFRDLVAPANNHIVRGTHISAYTRGVAFEQPAPPAALPIGNFIGGGAFILERESNTTKSEDYVAIEMYARDSEVGEVLIQSNTFGGNHSRIGVRVSNHNNKVSASFKNCEYPFDVVPYTADAASGCVYAQAPVISGPNLVRIDKSSSPNLVYTNLIDPTVGSAGLIQRCASYRVRHNAADRYLLRLTTGGLALGDHLTATQTLDFSTTVTGTSSYDAQILATGGDNSTNGKGDFRLTCASLRVNGLAVRPESSGGASVGQPSYPFSTVYANTGTIQASDERLKDRIVEVPDEVLDAFSSIQHKMYKFKEAIADKGGDGARWHFGVIAQEVESAFKAKGMDAFEYGVLGYDSWEEQPEVVRSWEQELDGAGNIIVEAGSEIVTAYAPAGDRYSVRYDELLALEAALMRRTTMRLEQRIASLEELMLKK